MDMTISELNAELIKTSRTIATKSNEVDKARYEYLMAKDEYELKYSLEMDTLKTANSDLTQTDLKSKATIKTMQQKLDMRIKDAKYHSLLSDLKALNSMLESLQEVSYNMRAELRLTRN